MYLIVSIAFSRLAVAKSDTSCYGFTVRSSDVPGASTSGTVATLVASTSDKWTAGCSIIVNATSAKPCSLFVGEDPLLNGNHQFNGAQDIFTPTDAYMHDTTGTLVTFKMTDM